MVGMRWGPLQTLAKRLPSSPIVPAELHDATGSRWCHIVPVNLHIIKLKPIPLCQGGARLRERRQPPRSEGLCAMIETPLLSEETLFLSNYLSCYYRNIRHKCQYCH